MSSTIESKSARDTREHPTNSRVSSFDVRPSVAGMIADSEGNLDEKKTVAALSQTHNANKYLWTGSFVLIGVVLLLIAANIGISVVVARLTRQINVDPVTGMASIPGSDDVVMKTSEARYHEEDLNFHHVPIKHLSAMKTVDFADGELSFDVKGYARMSNETVLLVEGGSLVFDINGFKNSTGDEITRLFSSIEKDKESSDPDGRKLSHGGCDYPVSRGVQCGTDHGTSCPYHKPYCNEANGWCGDTDAHRDAQDSTTYDYCTIVIHVQSYGAGYDSQESPFGSSNTESTRDPRCFNCHDISPFYRKADGVPNYPGPCCLPAAHANGVRWGGSTCSCFGNEGDHPCWGENGDTWLKYCDACTACNTFSRDVRVENALPNIAEACCLGRSGGSMPTMSVIYSSGWCGCDSGETHMSTSERPCENPNWSGEGSCGACADNFDNVISDYDC